VTQGKQAKTLTPTQVGRALNEVKLSRYPEHDRVMVLMSFNAGLRAREIANLTWGMVLDAEGNVADVLELRHLATKGKTGGRQVPLCDELRKRCESSSDDRPDVDARIIHSERDIGMSAGSIAVWFGWSEERVELWRPPDVRDRSCQDNRGPWRLAPRCAAPGWPCVACDDPALHRGQQRCQASRGRGPRQIAGAATLTGSLLRRGPIARQKFGPHLHTSR